MAEQNTRTLGKPSSSADCRIHPLASPVKGTCGSSLDDHGSVELSFLPDLADIDQDIASQDGSDAETANASFEDLEALYRNFDTIRIANIRSYKAWVGERNLHIS